nr:MAG TPA: hypothetical protein [Caudoviricetes sp.]
MLGRPPLFFCSLSFPFATFGLVFFEEVSFFVCFAMIFTFF